MGKIKIKKTSDGNIKIITFSGKKITEEIIENEPRERADNFDVRTEFLVTGSGKTTDEEI